MSKKRGGGSKSFVWWNIFYILHMLTLLLFTCTLESLLAITETAYALVFYSSSTIKTYL